jgi:hypothetical protein
LSSPCLTVSPRGRLRLRRGVLLDRLGCVDCFPSAASAEVSRSWTSRRAAAAPEKDGLIREELAGGVSYAAARQRAAERLAGRALPLLTERNNILGVEYIKALKRLRSSIEPLTVRRDRAFKSASELRRTEAYLGELPVRAAEVFAEEILAGRGPVRRKTRNGRSRQAARHGQGRFRGPPDSGEGLADRFLQAQKLRKPSKVL